MIERVNVAVAFRRCVALSLADQDLQLCPGWKNGIFGQTTIASVSATETVTVNKVSGAGPTSRAVTAHEPEGGVYKNAT